MNRYPAGTICIVGMHFAPETTGNAPYTTEMALALSKAGFRVHVVAGVPHYPEWRVADGYRRGLRWFEARDGYTMTRVRHHVPRRPDLQGRMVMEASFRLMAGAAVRQVRPVATIAVSPTLSGLWAAAAGSPRQAPLGVLVQDLVGSGAEESGVTSAGTGRAIAAAEYRLMRQADLVGVISPRFAERLSSEGGVDRDRIRDLPNFSHIEPVAVSRRESRRLLGWDENVFTVVHTGNVGRKQGLEVLVEAARLTSADDDWSFVVVGDGNQRGGLQDRARGVDCLRFVDPVPADLYPHVLNAADVLVLAEKPGVREMSLPSKLTSYAVARRPIVASVDSNGVTAAFLRQAGAASPVTHGDPAALLEGLRSARHDPASWDSEGLRRRIGGRQQATRRYVEFAYELVATTRPVRGRGR